MINKWICEKNVLTYKYLTTVEIARTRRVFRFETLAWFKTPMLGTDLCLTAEQHMHY